MPLRKAVVMGANGLFENLQPSDTLDIPNDNYDVFSLNNGSAGSHSIGQIVYISAADTAGLARADALGTTNAYALCRSTSVAAAASGTYQSDGILIATTAQWDVVTGGSGGLTPGASYFLSAATAGGMTTTPPSTAGQFIVFLGIAKSTTEFDITLNRPFKL